MFIEAKTIKIVIIFIIFQGSDGSKEGFSQGSDELRIQSTLLLDKMEMKRNE